MIFEVSNNSSYNNANICLFPAVVYAPCAINDSTDLSVSRNLSASSYGFYFFSISSSYLYFL